MPIDPDAISRFLKQAPTRIPPFKGMDAAVIHQQIIDTTGKKYIPLTEPRYWQLEGLAFALYVQRGLLFYSPRLGKTKIALDWARHLKKCGLWKGKGLVVAHAPIGLDVWMGEAKKHSNLKLFPVQNSADKFVDAIESDADLVVVPWSGLQAIFSVRREVARGSKRGQTKLYPDYEIIKMASKCFSLCVLDEIHFCKNRDSLRFKIAERIVQDCWFRLGLTGTPVGRDALAIWPQAYLIDNGDTLRRNYYFFQDAFGKTKKGFRGRDEWVFDYSKMPIVQRKLSSIALSYKFEEVHDIKVIDGIVELRMGREQAKAYQDVMNKVIELNQQDRTKVQNYFVRLRQIASGFLPFIDENGVERIVNFPNSAKHVWLQDFVSQLGHGRQIVVFHEFTRSGETICADLKKAGVSHSWLYGGSKDRSKELSDFQTGRSQVLVVNTAIGGASIDLAVADYLCFFESPVSPTIRQQAEARPMARTGPLMRDDLVCAPIEQKILSFVREGKDLLREILRNPQAIRG